MIKLRMLALACGIALAAGPLAHVAPAQSKEGKKDTKAAQAPRPQNSGGYRFVSGDETLTSGDQVTISRKGAGKLTGVFVYADPKSGKLYIRPKAGQPPVAVASADVENIERIRPAATTGKGGVRPAIETGDKAAPTYEIHTLTVHNGPETPTFYYGTSLSSAERDQLNALERARSDIMQKRARVESLSQAIDSAAAPPVSVVQSGTPGAVAPYFAPYAFYGYYPMAFSPWIGGWPGYSFGWMNYGYEVPALAYYPNMVGAGSATTIVENTGTTGQGVAALTKALHEAETALAEARKNYVAASQRAIYDNDGRIVAVRLAE